MNVLRLLLLLLVAAAPLALRAQDQPSANAPILFKPLPGVVFYWQVMGTDSATGKNRFFMTFHNSSDSLAAFTYVVISGKDERVVGRLDLRARSDWMSGWVFASDRISTVGVSDVVLTKDTLAPADTSKTRGLPGGGKR